MDFDEDPSLTEGDDVPVSRENEFYINMSLDSPLTARNLLKATSPEGRMRKSDMVDVYNFELTTSSKRRTWDICVHHHIRSIFLLFEKCPPTDPSIMTLSTAASLKLLTAGPCKSIKLTRSAYKPSESLKRLTFYSEWFDYSNVARVRHNFDVKSQGKRSRLETQHLSNLLSVYFGENLALIEYFGKRILVTQEGFSMLCDLVRSRRNALLYTELRNHFKIEVQIPIAKLFTLWSCGDRITEKAGNDGIVLLKMWEPLVNGKLAQLSKDPILDDNYFYSKMSSEFLEESVNIGARSEAEDLYRFLDSVKDIDELVEYHGLAKTFGHPFVFIEKAIEKNKKMAMPYKTVNREVAEGIKAEMIKGICEGHFKKYSSWPKAYLSRLQNPPLSDKEVPSLTNPDETEYQRKKKSPIIKAFLNRENVDYLLPSYHKSDWGKIFLVKNNEDYKTLNPLSILKDKSCSPTLSQLLQSFVQKEPVDWTTKRVLSNFLFNNYPSPSQFIEDVDQNGIDKEHLLIGLSPKEREMNSSPRLFSIMPMALKQYFGYGEEIIAQVFLPFFEECTMKDDQMKLTNKFIKNVVSTQNNSQTVNYYISIDYQKWNLNFRRCNTEMYFEVLDAYLGLNNFLRRTHKIFEDIRFYFDDYDCPLKPDHNGDIEDSFYTWRGQGGGCEGLRQKGWTLITICALRYALSFFDEDLSFDILGQGDNQVICLKIPCPYGKKKANLSEEEKINIKDLAKKVLDKIFEVSEAISLPIKIEETWYSTSMFNYGKNIFINGMPKGTALKRILRTYPYSNEEYPTLSAALTSLSAACLSALPQSCTPILPFIFQTVKCYEIVDHHIGCGVLNSAGIRTYIGGRSASSNMHRRFTQNISLFQASLVRKRSQRSTLLHFAFALGCNVLGGSPLSTVWEFFLRGSPDPLTLQVSFLYALRNETSLNQEELKVVKSLLDPVLDSEGLLSNIIEDPLSINIVQGISTVGTMKRRAREVLGDPSVKNVAMKEALQIGFNYEESINNYLLSIKPYYATATTDIKKGTLPGLVRSWEGRFDNTRTIVKYARQKGVSLWQEIRDADANTTLGWMYQLSNKGRNEKPPCPTIYAQQLRDDSWSLAAGKRFEVKGVTCPHPFHLFKRVNVICSCEECLIDPTRIELFYSRGASNDPSLLCSKIGKCHPYLGSGTKEKLATKAWETKRVPMQVLTAAKNLRLDGWGIQKGSNLSNFLRATLGCYTDADPTLFETKEGYATGGMDHRLSTSSVQKQGILPTLLTPSTHATINTNNMGIYSRGSGNYPIHFQGINVCNLVLETASRLTSRQKSGQSTHLHLNCKECLVELDNDFMETPIEGPKIPSLPEKSPFFVKGKDITKTVMSKIVLQTENAIPDFSGMFNKESLRYNIVGRRCACMIMADNPSRTSVPASWFFDMDMSMLFKSIRYYCASYHLTKMLGSDRIMAVKRTKNLTYRTIYREVAQILFSKDDEFFKCLTTVFQEERNLAQLARLELTTVYYPPSYPSTYKSILSLIKNSIMVDWSSPKVEHLYLIDEVKHSNAIRMIFGSCLMQGLLNEDEIMPQTGGYTYISECDKRFKELVKSEELENITMNEVLEIVSNYDVFDKSSKYYAVYVQSACAMSEMIVSFLKTSIKIVEAGDDYVVKALRTERRFNEPPRPKTKKRISHSDPIRMTYGKPNKLSFSSFEDARKEHQTCANIPRILATTKGTLLHSIAGVLSLDQATVYIVADGAGGTSLSLSLHFPDAEIHVLPFIPEGDIFSQSLSVKPPEVCRFNPGANVVVEQSSIDITSEDSVEILRSIPGKETVFFLDLDSIGPHIPQWIENFVNGSLNRRSIVLVSGYSRITVELVSGWISTVSTPKIYRSTIEGSESYVIDFKAYKEIKKDYVASLSLIGSVWVHDSFEDWEKLLVPYRENLLKQSRSYLSFFKSSNDQQSILEKLLFRLDDFIRNPLYESKTRTHSRLEMNRRMADILARMIMYLSQCGYNRTLSLDNKFLVISKTLESGETEKNTRDLNEVGCFLTLGKPNMKVGKFKLVQLYESKYSSLNNTHVKAFCDSLPQNHNDCTGQCGKKKILQIVRHRARSEMAIYNFYPSL